MIYLPYERGMKMVNWLIIIVLVVIAVFALKINHLRHRFWIIFVVFLALFLYATIAIVYKGNDLKLEKTEDIFTVSKVYLGWLAHGFQNMKALTGNAINMNWASTNGTFVDKTSSKSPANTNKPGK